MPRDIPVGNDSFLITFDHDYSLRDIYYPCVGKENFFGDTKRSKIYNKAVIEEEAKEASLTFLYALIF